METIKDLWASLVASITERSTNPLTSAFFLTWAAWNYKFFVVLFSDEAPAEKFAAIAVLYPQPDALLKNALLFPAITTLLYVFAYPFVTSRVVTFYRRQQVQIANKLKAVEGERVRTVDEVTQMVRRFEKRIKRAEDEATEALQELTTVRNALQAAETELTNNRSTTSTGTGTVSDVGEVRNPAPSSAVSDDRYFHQYSWQVREKDGSSRMQTLTVEQARILHFVGKIKPKSSSEIASKLKLELDAVNLDIRVLVQIGAIMLTNGTLELTPDGRGILGVVNTNGLIDELNDEALSSDLAFAKNKRIADSEFKI